MADGLTTNNNENNCKNNERLARNGSAIGSVSFRSVQPNLTSEIVPSTLVLGLQKWWLMAVCQKRWKVKIKNINFRDWSGLVRSSLVFDIRPVVKFRSGPVVNFVCSGLVQLLI